MDATSPGHHADSAADAHRWIVVDGRRWRATDPTVPEGFRLELVDELMSARRAVAAGRRSGSDEAVAAARARVSDTKVALGERGEPWWEPPSVEGRRTRIEATIRALARHRGPDRTICPSDVARSIGGANWRPLMPTVRDAARDLASAGDVEILQKFVVIEPLGTWKGPVRIRIVSDAADGAATPPAPRSRRTPRAPHRPDVPRRTRGTDA
jgi:hypothetical protein